MCGCESISCLLWFSKTHNVRQIVDLCKLGLSLPSPSTCTICEISQSIVPVPFILLINDILKASLEKFTCGTLEIYNLSQRFEQRCDFVKMMDYIRFTHMCMWLLTYISVCMHILSVELTSVNIYKYKVPEIYYRSWPIKNWMELQKSLGWV